MVKDIKRNIYSYFMTKQRPLDFFLKSTTISLTELRGNGKEFIQNPDLKHLAILAKTAINSSTWVTNSSLRLLRSLMDPPQKKYLDRSKKDFFEAVEYGERIDTFVDHPSILFEMVFREREYMQFNKHKKALINLPKINETIVLVSGVFNEFFSTPAFERGARHLAKTYGLKYFSPKVSGNKSAEHNSNLLYEQIMHYHQENPNEKLWLIGFSKGGVDCLHFLANHSNEVKDFITGLSTIASPIQGSKHFNNRLLEIVRKIETLPHYDKLNSILNNRLSIEKDLRESLSKDIRESWFEKNKHRLPKHLFYSAVGLRAEWHESHFWMIVMKLIIRSSTSNDGVVDTEDSLFPEHFNAYNLGVLNGHHLIGTRSSYFSQEALLESLIITLFYLRRFEKGHLSNSSKLAC